MAVTTEVDRNTIIYTKGINGANASTVYCLSTDVVHNADGTISIPKVKNPYNAQRAYEMDSTDTESPKIHKVYMYDAENNTWLEQ